MELSSETSAINVPINQTLNGSNLQIFVNASMGTLKFVETVSEIRFQQEMTMLRSVMLEHISIPVKECVCHVLMAV